MSRSPSMPSFWWRRDHRPRYGPRGTPIIVLRPNAVSAEPAAAAAELVPVTFTATDAAKAAR